MGSTKTTRSSKTSPAIAAATAAHRALIRVLCIYATIESNSWGARSPEETLELLDPLCDEIAKIITDTNRLNELRCKPGVLEVLCDVNNNRTIKAMGGGTYTSFTHAAAQVANAASLTVITPIVDPTLSKECSRLLLAEISPQFPAVTVQDVRTHLLEIADILLVSNRRFGLKEIKTKLESEIRRIRAAAAANATGKGDREKTTTVTSRNNKGNQVWQKPAGGRERKWDKLIALYERMKAEDPTVTHRRVCAKYNQQNPNRKKKPTTKSLSDALNYRRNQPNG